MKKVLFVDITKIKDKSIIDDNTDEKIISNALLEVQELELLPLIGKPLYKTLSDEIKSGSTITGYTITPANKEILDEVVIPFLIYGTLVASVIPLMYKLNNKGLNKATDPNLQSASGSELESVKSYYKERFDSYKRRLIEYFSTDENQETNVSSSEDTTSSFLGIYLPDAHDDSQAYAESRAYKTNYYRRF